MGTRTYTYINGTSGAQIVRMTLAQARGMSHQGDCEDSVLAELDKLEWIGSLDAIRETLKETGAYDDLDTASEETLRMRAVWIAAGYISEDPECYADSDPQFLADAVKAGPGLDGYAYNADVYCVPCARKICEDLAEEGKLADPGTLEFSDSECQPQPIFFGESPDCAQHCGECGEYLYGEDSEEESDSEEETDTDSEEESPEDNQ